MASGNEAKDKKEKPKGPPLTRSEEWFTKNSSFVNKFIFPAPNPSYDKNSFPDQLCWIPKRIEDALEYGALTEDQVIPALLCRNYSPNCNYLMIYLHGNAADLGRCRSLCKAMMTLVGCHVLAVEYPGYGIFPGWPTETSVCETAHQVYNWVVSPYGMNWPPNQIIVFGRSVGSGPAVDLCQQQIKPLVPPPSKYPPPAPSNSGGFVNGVISFFNAAGCVGDDASAPSTVETQPLSKKKQEKVPDFSSMQYPDPFLSLPQSNFMIENLLSKAGVEYEPTWPPERLIKLARDNDLVPPLDVCLRSNKSLKCALLVLYAPFESISDVVSSYLKVASYLISNRFNNIDKIKDISCPLCIIHSEKDEIIPIQQGYNIFKRAREHQLNCKFHKISELLHNETNVRRDIAGPISEVLNTREGKYVPWDPPQIVFRKPLPIP